METKKTTWNHNVTMETKKTTWNYHVTMETKKKTWKCHVTRETKKTTWNYHATMETKKKTWKCHVTRETKKTTWNYHVTMETKKTTKFNNKNNHVKIVNNLHKPCIRGSPQAVLHLRSWPVQSSSHGPTSYVVSLAPPGEWKRNELKKSNFFRI